MALGGDVVVKVVEGVVDREGWESGPWDGEGDRVEWVDEETGYPCLILRHPTDGHLCGYTAVPPGHPLHGSNYVNDDMPCGDYPAVNFTEACVDYEALPTGIKEIWPEALVVCHVPAPGEPDDVWWLGFDCGHYLDVQPGRRAREKKMEALHGWEPLPVVAPPWGPIYRGVAVVTEMVATLAADLKAMT